MSKIFISYSRQSKEKTRSLVEDLESLGHDVWFDRELSGGQSWWDRILETIRDCHVFVFVLEPHALNSVACKREFGYAGELGKFVVPVLVADEVSINLLPPELSRIQHVDYRRQDREGAISLARALNKVPPPEPLPDPLPPPPEVPTSYLGSISRRIAPGSTLSYEEQSALVLDLKAVLRNPETQSDTRTLLEKLRKRRDLFASIAQEIDDLLADRGERPFGTSQPIDELPESEGKSIEILAPTPHASLKPETTHTRGKLGAMIGFGIGLLWIITDGSDLVSSALGVALCTWIGWSVAGAIGTIRAWVR